MRTDQTIRQDDLGDGHAEASDQYHDKLTHQPLRRQDVIQADECERNKRCSEPCEGHDRLVEEGREPSLPSGQRKKVNAARNVEGESRVWLACRTGVHHA